jgi:hypothetical protein
MAFPALLFVEPLPAKRLTLPSDVDEAAYAELAASAHTLATEYKRARAVESSDEERQLMVRWFRFSLDTFGLLGETTLTGHFRGALDSTRRDLFERELAATDLRAKFALRQIQEAAKAFGVLIESFAFFFQALPEKALEAALRQAKNELASNEVELAPEHFTLSRFQLDLAAALASLDDPIEELSYWAARAELGAQKVIAMIGAVVPLRERAETAHFKARYAWLAWTPEDVEQELEPWPTGLSQ